MKTLVIQSESKKGLFTDKAHENDLSEEVRKAFQSGEKEVVLTEEIIKSGKKLTLTGFVPRGTTSKDSSFIYKVGEKKYICKNIREFFGLPLYSKPHTSKFEPCTNLELATREETEKELKRLQAHLKNLEEKEKAEKLDKELQRALQNVSKEKLLEILKKQNKKK